MVTCLHTVNNKDDCYSKLLDKTTDKLARAIQEIEFNNSYNNAVEQLEGIDELLDQLTTMSKTNIV